MSNQVDEVWETFKERLDALIASYQSPEEWRIGHGNLRHEYSEWQDDDQCSTNIAIVYETPGGSTTQLNYTFNHQTGEFTHLDEHLEHHIVTTDPEKVLEDIKQHIEGISRKRMEALKATIDSWLGQGKMRSQVFAELNKLLQSEFLGGRVTSAELKAGIQYVVTCYGKRSDAGTE